MPKLTLKQSAFLDKMLLSSENARYGFSMLTERQDFILFFDGLSERGFFNPDKNPAPVSTGQHGHYNIQIWDALIYLRKAAKLACDEENIALAEKILEIIINVSSFKENDGKMRDNHHTFEAFIEILSLLPLKMIKEKHLHLIQLWLSSQFYLGSAISTLDKLIERLLNSTNPADWKKSIIPLKYCLQIKWSSEPGTPESQNRPAFLTDSYFLDELIKRHSVVLGKQIGFEAATIFVEKIKEVFFLDKNDSMSWISRPAIEEHEQNITWHGVENCLIRGLRDILLGWSEKNPNDAKIFITNLFNGERNILVRIGLFIASEKWPLFRDAVYAHIGKKLFEMNYVHEVYLILTKHFSEMDPACKQAFFTIISNLEVSSKVSNWELAQKRLRRDWLSLITNKGFPEADMLFAKLNASKDIGPTQEHLGFNMLMGPTTFGPGPSLYSVDELVIFLRNGELIPRLNNFKEMDHWNGPTLRALSDTLESAIVSMPEEFCGKTDLFKTAKGLFQFSLLSGFRKAWESDIRHEILSQESWDSLWNKILGFILSRISESNFWEEENPDVSIHAIPTNDWIKSIIPDLLHSGTQKDSHAYTPNLLETSLKIIEILLEKLEVDHEKSEDSMFQSLNMPRGKVVRALIGQALRECRFKDANDGNHATVWLKYKTLLENELSKCTNANFCFSTWMGVYLVNLDYLNSNWLIENFDKIFPQQYTNNFIASLEGVAYAQPHKKIWKVLIQHAILENGLRLEIPSPGIRKQLLEKITLGYIWGIDNLNSQRFNYLFNENRIEDVTHIAATLWTFRDGVLTEEQNERILLFWEHCSDWAKTYNGDVSTLMSTLSRLANYFVQVSDREKRLLLEVAPYTKNTYETNNFFKCLGKLAEKNAKQVNDVLKRLLEHYTPLYDFDGQLLSLFKKLEAGGCKADVILYVNQVRDINGMSEYYSQLSQ